MKKNYQMKKNLIIPILFLNQHNCILSRQVVYKKAYDISRKGSHPHSTPTLPQNLNITNHRVYLFFLISIQLFEYYYLFLFNYWNIIVCSYFSNYWLLYIYTPCDL